MTQTFCERVIASAIAHQHKVAMVAPGIGGSEQITFGEMLAQIRCLAYRITQEGIAFGDRVALLGENHPHWALAYSAFCIVAQWRCRLTRLRRWKH